MHGWVFFFFVLFGFFFVFGEVSFTAQVPKSTHTIDAKTKALPFFTTIKINCLPPSQSR